jgi:hypothetical protein
VCAAFGVGAALSLFFAAKLMDRVSKGVREAPSKAIINELARESGDSPDAAYGARCGGLGLVASACRRRRSLSPPRRWPPVLTAPPPRALPTPTHNTRRTTGLRQSMATGGMLLGSSIAAATFAATGQSYVLTFAAAAVPAGIALLWLLHSFSDELFGGAPAGGKLPAAPSPAIASVTLSSMDEPPAAAAAGAGGGKAAPEELEMSLLEKGAALVRSFSPAYWQALAVVAVLYFARFDASFLSLRARQVMPRAGIPLIFLVCSLMQAVLTAPLSKVSGRSVAHRNGLLLAGFAAMVATNAVFALPATASQLGACGRSLARLAQPLPPPCLCGGGRRLAPLFFAAAAPN